MLIFSKEANSLQQKNGLGLKIAIATFLIILIINEEYQIISQKHQRFQALKKNVFNKLENPNFYARYLYGNKQVKGRSGRKEVTK